MIFHADFFFAVHARHRAEAELEKPIALLHARKKIQR